MYTLNSSPVARRPYRSSVRLPGLMLAILGAVLLFACSPASRQTGILEGHVSIGPLTPVERVGEPTPTPDPMVYASREVVIYRADGKTEYTRVKIDINGNYRAELPVGIYVVDINHLGIDNAKGLPGQVEISAGEVTRLDIDIDTGIR